MLVFFKKIGYLQFFKYFLIVFLVQASQKKSKIPIEVSTNTSTFVFYIFLLMSLYVLSFCLSADLTLVKKDLG